MPMMPVKHAVGERLSEVPFWGEPRPVPKGLVVHQGLMFTNTQPRTPDEVDLLYVHDNAGPGNPTTYFEQVKRFGVHWFIELDGRVWFHGDAGHALVHGGRYNRRSVAIELRNGSRVNNAHPLQRQYIKTRFAGRMLLYTDAQIYAFDALVRWLLMELPEIPLKWPGAKEDGTMRYHRFGRHGGGVAAHHYDSSHADGSLAVAVAKYAIEDGLSVDEAWERVKTEASIDGKVMTVGGELAFRPLGPQTAPKELRNNQTPVLTAPVVLDEPPPPPAPVVLGNFAGELVAWWASGAAVGRSAQNINFFPRKTR